ncbi:hypothetical protein IAT38_006243 [Cryptococcus sp. DSM 104549]
MPQSASIYPTPSSSPEAGPSSSSKHPAMLPATDPLQARSRPSSPAKLPAATTAAASSSMSVASENPAFGRRGSAFAKLGERDHQAGLAGSSHPHQSSPLASGRNNRVGEESSSRPSSRNRPLTPKSEVESGGKTALTAGKSGSGRPSSKKGREALEMTAVGLAKDGSGRGKPRVEMSAAASAAKAERSKEDAALAKWRKWVIEQPPQVAQPNTSPIRGGSRQTSPNGQTFPMVTLGTASPHTSGSNHSPLSPSTSNTPNQPRRNSTDGPTFLTSPITSPPTNSSRFSSPAPEIYNTESVLALRDVELAIDEDLLERTQKAKTMPRRMSSRARLSGLPNPFVDLASRLASRRVRPIVLELVQALGHYVDAVWCVAYPDRPCPWIIGVDESPVQPSIRRMMIACQADGAAPATSTAVPASGDSPNADLGWKSPMITAVQEGKRSGHVASPPTAADVHFWEEEARFALKDVDEVVGIYKGVGWAFARALGLGEYGEVDSENVVGRKGEGAGMARLLNDLEEALWGDAPPRPTDLAYDLPIDFDPYAIPDDNDLQLIAGQAGPRGASSPLASFFSDGAASGAANGGEEHKPPGEEIYDVPDLYVPGEDTAGAGAGGAGSPRANGTALSPALPSQSLPSPTTSPTLLSVPKPAGRSTKRATAAIPGIERIEGAEGMTLEELGKKRHQEWVAMRKKEDEEAAAKAAAAKAATANEKAEAGAGVNGEKGGAALGEKRSKEKAGTGVEKGKGKAEKGKTGGALTRVKS